MEEAKSPGKLTEGGQITINRPVYQQTEFDEIFQKIPESPVSIKYTIRKKIASSCSCTGLWWKKTILDFFPFINASRTYKFREYLLYDIMAGINVGIVHIPQSMGFAILASLPPVYGLYTSFWQPLIYFFLAVSYHNSFATMAVPSLILSVAVDREILNFQALQMGNATGNETLISEEMLGAQKAAIATTVTFLAGVIQIAMSVLHLDFVTTFMPPSFISAFTTACAFFIASAQFKHLFGVPAIKYSGLWRLTLGWADIASKLPDTNIATLCLAIFSFVFLIVIKEYINMKFKDKLKFPIPAELLLVIIATSCSYYFDFEDRWKVIIIGNIPKGFPTPAVPPLDIASNVVMDSLVCAILSFVISISMANIFTRKYKYTVDSNQELLAYGVTHTLSCFFHSFAGAVAPPRCFVFEQTGGKTRFAHLISCVLLFLVISVMAPLFQALPTAVLGSIIVVALFPLFKQFKDLKDFWILSKVDFSIWLATWLFTSATDVGFGLLISLMFVFLVTVVQTQFVKGNVIGSLGSTGLYAATEHYKKAEIKHGVRIFHFPSSLYYATVQRFKRQLYEATVDPLKHIACLRETAPESQLQNHETQTIEPLSTNSKPQEPEASVHKDVDIAVIENRSVSCNIDFQDVSHCEQRDQEIKAIILDCSCFSFVDVMCLNTLQDLYEDYKKAGIEFVLCNCTEAVRTRLLLAGVIGTATSMQMFPTVHDAVSAATFCLPDNKHG